MRLLRSCLQLAVGLSFALVSCSVTAADKSEADGPFKSLKIREIGPAAGGRASRAVGVPGDPLTYYVAAASGGVWKSIDGGMNWKPIFDDEPTSSIGSIALAPSNPSVIYVGTGEANIRGNVAPGDGIYRSTDGGKTWQNVWKQVGQIGRMMVHPVNPEVAFAAVLGSAFGPSPERGVYRTKDGGHTWQRVLSKDADTGACDVCFDPNNPNVLFACLWQARRMPWGLTSGGPGSGLYVSRDGGDTWKQLGGHGMAKDDLKGLPEGIYGKSTIVVAPSDSRRVYALIEAEKGGLYRSEDGGEKWELVNGNHYLRIRPWYFTNLTIDPSNADIIWSASLRLLKSVDGGATFKSVKGSHHVDHHDVWIDAKNPKRMINCNDGGIDLSNTGGESWFAPLLPIGQFYHVSVDNRMPYHVMGSMQDLGTAAGPSNSLAGPGIALGDWYGVGGGEAGHTASDPDDPNVVYATEYQGYLSRFDFRNHQVRNVGTYPYVSSGRGPEDLKYRFQWTSPVVISKHDSKMIYHGANVLLRSNNAGQTWTAISPDLTRNDKGKQRFSGGPITGDNTGAEYYCTIFAIAESPVKEEVIWVGSDDGMVHVTEDGGKSWTNVTANVPGIPEWGTVSMIEASPFDSGTAYLVVDAHRLNNNKPYLYKTTDLGKTWKSLADKLPQDVHLHAIRQDPKRRGMLYLGTERGLTFSRDDGETWQPLKLNFPTVPVHDLVVKNDDLVIATHGRSLWIFDDITPIRDFSPAVADKDFHLFPAQAAARYRYHGTLDSASKRTTFDNPPKGMVFNYYLKKKPEGEMTLEITDAQGKLIDRFTDKEEKPEESEDAPDAPDEPFKKPHLPKDVGIQRFVWEMEHAGAKVIKGAKVDVGQPADGAMVAPGFYKAKLTVGGTSMTTDLVVKPDPRLNLKPEEYAEQERFTLACRDAITKVTEYVEGLRALKKQLTLQNELLAANDKAKKLVQLGKETSEKADTLENKFHNAKAEVTYDILAQPGGAKLYSKLSGLYDWSKDSDGVPTDGMKGVLGELQKELRQYESEYKALVAKDVAAVNEEAKKLELPRLLAPSGK